MLIHRLISATTAVAVLAIACSPAAAAGHDEGRDGRVTVNPITNPGGGGSGDATDVDVRADDPGHAGHPAEPISDGSKSRAGSSTCSFVGHPVNCTNPEWGTWYAPQQCWIRLMSPQPGRDDAIWDGHDDGAIYWCQPPPFGGGIGGGHMMWLARRASADAIDPVVLAQRAVDSMRLVGAKVGATPLNGGEGIVGLQTWLWVANDGPTSMGPITRTARAGSVSVQATARVTQVSWDMGDGHTQRCRNAGTVWRSGARGSTGDSPTCGYTYLTDSGDRPGDVYTIHATTHWQVDWTGARQSGQITFTIDGAELAMPVVELQTVRVG